MITKTLSELSIKISSGLTPLRSNPIFWENGTIPWLKTEQLGDKYIYDTNEHITPLALEKTNIRIFPVNSLSIAMYGEGKTRGNLSILKNEMATNQACCNVELDPNKADYEYVYYFLKTQYEELRNLSSGVRKNLNSNDIKNFPIRLPLKIKEQQDIARILKVLDDKIELNRYINSELEAMAKTLYDYWFVQFDFPDNNGHPYKSSGGKMVYNSILKRKIPTDWIPVRLNELFTNGAVSISPAEIDQNANYTPIDSLPMKKMSFSNTRSSNEANSSLIKYMKNDILIGAMRVYFHRVCIAPFNGITRTTTLVLRPKKANFLPYLYQVCNEDRVISTAQRISVGTQQPYVNWDNAFENIMLAYPKNDNVINRYSSIMNGVVSAVTLREKENAHLEKLRDWLLPMLMNGQVTTR